MDSLLKRAFYRFMEYYMRFFIEFFFSRLEIKGRENIPVGKPIIYSCNHQNAFMDALIVGTVSPVKITSMTRSDVFKTRFRWFMDALQMIPIYRMRDGIEKLALNDKIFASIQKLLKNEQGILIFSEGNHGNEFFLRPLSKGSSRMALDALRALPEKEDIFIVPVGLNYFHHQRPCHKLSIVFGEPISTRKYLLSSNENEAKAINLMKAELTEKMKATLLLPEENEKYQQKKNYINWRNEKYPFGEFKSLLDSEYCRLTEASPSKKIFLVVGRVLGVFNFLPLIILSIVLKKFKDIVFYASVKFLFGLVIFPLWWLLVFVSLFSPLGYPMAILIVLGQISILFARQYCIRWSNVSH